jgi:molybdopterin-guanine dinucleotide biosynthesis protein A
MPMKKLLGVILCGDEKLQADAEKGLRKIGDITWAEHVAAKLDVFEIPFVYSLNALQLPAFSAIFPQQKLVVDNVEVHGPLKGLLSVHKNFPGSNLLLLSYDMLDMDEDTIRNITGIYQQQNGYEFYVYQDKDFAQPFSGIYTSQGLARVSEKMKQHTLHSFSLQSVLNEGHTLRLKIEDEAAFRNYNLS